MLRVGNFVATEFETVNVRRFDVRHNRLQSTARCRRATLSLSNLVGSTNRTRRDEESVDEKRIVRCNRNNGESRTDPPDSPARVGRFVRAANKDTFEFTVSVSVTG